MPTAVVHLTLVFIIKDGELEAFQKVAREMIAGSRGEPGTLGYDWYLHGDGKTCRLVETYASADALLAHLNGPVVQQLVPKLLEHAVIDRSEVLGHPGAQAGAMLARLGAQMFGHWGGLGR